MSATRLQTWSSAVSNKELPSAKITFIVTLLFIYLFLLAVLGLHYCAGFSIIAVNRGHSPAAVCRPLSSCSARASHCSGFSCCATWALGLSGFSSCCSWGLGHKWNSCVKSCGTWTQLLCGMWKHPRPRIEPRSPSLEGRFFTTEPPGKPCGGFNIMIITLTIWTVIHQFFVLFCFVFGVFQPL